MLAFQEVLPTCLLTIIFLVRPILAVPLDIHYATSPPDPVPAKHLLHRGILSERTDTPGGLWGANGVPDRADLDQTSIPDCGLIATLGALVSQDPRWITNLFEFIGDAATTTAVTVKFKRGMTLEPITQTVQKSALDNVRSDAHEGWWVGALEKAFVVNEGGIEGIFPDRVLEMIGGRPAAFKFASDGNMSGVAGTLTKDEYWNLIVQNAPKTPLILHSLTGATLLTGMHAFWIMAGHIDGKRWISLWNPHGENEVHDFDVVWPAIRGVHMFADLSMHP